MGSSQVIFNLLLKFNCLLLLQGENHLSELRKKDSVDGKNDFIKAWLFVRTLMFQKLFESNPVMSALVKRARIFDSTVMVSYAAAVNVE